MPEAGGYRLLEHADGRDGKPVGEKQGLWSGLTAPGEAFPFVFALSVCLGALIYLSLEFEPDKTFIGGLGGLALLCFYVLAKNRFQGLLAIAVRICMWLVLGVILGMRAGILRVHTVAAPTITSELGPVIVEGWVSAVEPAKTGVRLAD